MPSNFNVILLSGPRKYEISSYEPVSSQKYENGYRTKICNFTAEKEGRRSGWDAEKILTAADLAEVLPPVTFVVARRCRRTFKSGCVALSFKSFFSFFLNIQFDEVLYSISISQRCFFVSMAIVLDAGSTLHMAGCANCCLGNFYGSR